METVKFNPQSIQHKKSSEPFPAISSRLLSPSFPVTRLNLIVRPLEPAPKNVKPSILPPSPLLGLSWRGAQQPAIFTLRTRLSGSVNASWSSEEGGKEGNGVSGHLFPKKEDFDSSIPSFFSVKGGRGRAGLA